MTDKPIPFTRPAAAKEPSRYTPLVSSASVAPRYTPPVDGMTLTMTEAVAGNYPFDKTWLIR